MNTSKLPKSILFLFLLAALGAACAGQAPAPADEPEHSDAPLATATFAPTVGPLSELGLPGKLIYTQGDMGLWQIDLQTGQRSQLWAPPADAHVEGVAVSPDGQRLALAYAPEVSAVLRTDIYLLGADGSELQPLVVHDGPFETYANPVWSPDGRWIYFTHTDVLTDEGGGEGELVVNIERMAADGSGEPELVLQNAEQPTLSANGERMAYLRLDRESFGRAIWVSDVDGSNPRELVAEGTFAILSGLRISPDGGTVVFGASGPPSTTSAPFTDRAGSWLRAQPAEAHGLPWELWSIPADGGSMQPITDWDTDSPWPAWSPDGGHLAALQPGGVFLLQEGDPRYLGEAGGHGELAWSP